MLVEGVVAQGVQRAIGQPFLHLTVVALTVDLPQFSQLGMFKG
jgi:hypothetical protein